MAGKIGDSGLRKYDFLNCWLKFRWFGKIQGCPKALDHWTLSSKNIAWSSRNSQALDQLVQWISQKSFLSFSNSSTNFQLPTFNYQLSILLTGLIFFGLLLFFVCFSVSYYQFNLSLIAVFCFFFTRRLLETRVIVTYFWIQNHAKSSKTFY